MNPYFVHYRNKLRKFREESNCPKLFVCISKTNSNSAFNIYCREYFIGFLEVVYDLKMRVCQHSIHPFGWCLTGLEKITSGGNQRYYR